MKKVAIKTIGAHFVVSDLDGHIIHQENTGKHPRWTALAVYHWLCENCEEYEEEGSSYTQNLMKRIFHKFHVDARDLHEISQSLWMGSCEIELVVYEGWRTVSPDHLQVLEEIFSMSKEELYKIHQPRMKVAAEKSYKEGLNCPILYAFYEKHWGNL